MSDYDYDGEDDAVEHEKWIYMFHYDDTRLARLCILWAILAIGGWVLTHALSG